MLRKAFESIRSARVLSLWQVQLLLLLLILAALVLGAGAPGCPGFGGGGC